MIVRSLHEILDTDRDVHTPQWVSRRLLLKKDGMGFSMHETTIFAGAELEMCYANHLEAVYCIAGSGEIEDLKTKARYPIEVGTLYALNEHDHHVLRASTEMKMVCVFNPPVVGNETHNASGAYEIVEDAS